MTQAEKKRRQKNADYLARFKILSVIVDFDFKPKKTKEFTRAQKARITRLSTVKIDDERVNSQLYNVARNVIHGNAVFKKIRKSPEKKAKLKALKKSGIFTTNSGVVVFSPGAEKIEIKKRKKGFLIDYVIKPVAPKSKHIKRVAKERHEIFIPIPIETWRDEDLLAVYLADLEREYHPLHFRLAINGRQGKTLFEPSKIYRYITEYLPGNFFIDTPYVTGVYLIFKERHKILR